LKLLEEPKLCFKKKHPDAGHSREFPAWGLPMQWKVGGVILRWWKIDLIQLQGIMLMH